MDSILPYLESIPKDLLEPIELKDGAKILDEYMLGMFDNDRHIGTIVITPFENKLHVEIRIYSISRMLYYFFEEIKERLKNYFNILGLKSEVYYRSYQNNANPYGVLI